MATTARTVEAINRSNRYRIDRVEKGIVCSIAATS
jgi:hypothetical protein